MKLQRKEHVFLLSFAVWAVTFANSDHHGEDNQRRIDHLQNERLKRTSQPGPLDFYTQWANIKEMENKLLRAHMAQLASGCHHESSGSRETRGRALGPRDLHIVPPAPGSNLRPESYFDRPRYRDPNSERPLGPHDFHIVPPASSGQALGPYDLHIVPPAPFSNRPTGRPLGPHDLHVVPPSPFRPETPLGPQDIHVVPPSPSPNRPGRPLGPHDFHIVPPAPPTSYGPSGRPLGHRDFHVLPPASSRKVKRNVANWIMFNKNE